MKRNLFILSAIAAVGSANAVELMVNGGFEDAGGPLVGWTSLSDHDASANAGAFGGAHGGTNHAWLGAWGATDAEHASLSQMVSLAGMATATLSYWICGIGTAPLPQFAVKINGNTLEGGAVSTLPAYPGYVQRSFNVSAYVGGNATVEFSFAKNAGEADNSYVFDDVSLQAEAVPEPATILAMAGGVALLALRRRK